MKRGSSILEGMYDRIDAAIANVGRKKAQQKYQRKQRSAEVVLRGDHGTPWAWRVNGRKNQTVTDRSGRRYVIHPVSGSLTRVNRVKPRQRLRGGRRVNTGMGA